MADTTAPRGDEDLLAADRRTLIIGAIALVVLLLIGVVSAAVFTRSACDGIAPAPVAARTAGVDLDAALAAGLPGLDAEARAGVADGLAALAAELGPLVGAADVTGGNGLAVVDDGVAVTGPVTTVVDPTGAHVRATADLSGATVVGDGAHLYSLALVNPLTGQVDALQPLDAALGGLTCQDTATVATPLAFHLDAEGGELLLLRIDEDGGDPDLELRDPVAGSVWRARFEAGQAPAGTTAARLTAMLGDELVVAARRSTPDDGAAVVTAVSRGDGSVRWTFDREALLPAALADEVVAARVVAVTHDAVLVELAVEVRDGDDVTLQGPELLVLDAVDGARITTGALPLPGPVRAAGADDRGVVLVADVAAGAGAGVGSGAEVLRTVAGELTSLGGTGGPLADAGVLADGRVVVGGGGVAIVAGGSVTSIVLPVPVAAVAVHGPTTSVLLVDPAQADEATAGGGAVLVTFSR